MTVGGAVWRWVGDRRCCRPAGIEIDGGGDRRLTLDDDGEWRWLALFQDRLCCDRHRRDLHRHHRSRPLRDPFNNGGFRGMRVSVRKPFPKSPEKS